MKDSNSDYNVPIYVTSIGQRYVKVEDLIRSQRVQNTLKKMAEISEKHKQQPSTGGVRAD